MDFCYDLTQQKKTSFDFLRMHQELEKSNSCPQKEENSIFVQCNL